MTGKNRNRLMKIKKKERRKWKLIGRTMAVCERQREPQTPPLAENDALLDRIGLVVV